MRADEFDECSGFALFDESAKEKLRTEFISGGRGVDFEFDDGFPTNKLTEHDA